MISCKIGSKTDSGFDSCLQRSVGWLGLRYGSKVEAMVFSTDSDEQSRLEEEFLTYQKSSLQLACPCINKSPRT